ncbi:hypothetical protein FACS1894202_01170 [Clostridia bacterium]|nr:hypothetical protein FACS1894202_01170 [Clostridia bacterium]
MKTKLISALLATALMLFLMMTAPVAAFAADLPSSWAVDSVDRAESLGLATSELLNGFVATTTRAEFCRAVVNFLRKYGYNVDSVTPKVFEDTNDRDIGVAAALKITSGNNTAGTQFAPDLALTREQAATMLRNVMNVIGVNYSVTAAKWTDAKDISSWAKEAVDVMYGAKIMGGTSTTSLVFSPKTPYTHEASIATLVNLWEYAQKAVGTSQTSAHKYDMNDPNVKKYPFYATAKTAVEFQADMLAVGQLSWKSAAEVIKHQKDPDNMIDGMTFYDWRMKPIQKWVDNYCAANGLSYAKKTDDEKMAIVWSIRDSGRFEEFIGLWLPGFVLSDTDCAPISDAGIFLMTAMDFELFDNVSGTINSSPHGWNAYWSSTLGAIKHFDLDLDYGRKGAYTDELDEFGYRLD